MPFDGIVAQTARSRAELAIQAARETWPHLSALLNSYSEDETPSWLMNKMLALSHVTQGSAHDQLGCDSVLLARLIIQEQQLDQNKSHGKTGKYASRFHPSSSTATNVDHSGRARESYNTASTSRPLTVGEISANWIDGAVLSESLLIRYNINGSSPIPAIKNNILKILHKQQQFLIPPPSNPQITEALSVSKRKIFITLRHRSQIPIATSALSNLSLSFDVAHDASEPISTAFTSHTAQASNDKHTNNIFLVPPKDESESQAGIVRRIISKAHDDSSFFVIHSSLMTLNDLKHLFGDDRPCMINGLGKCTSIDKSIKMSLLMPTWADNTHPQQHNNAEMDPWMNIIGETDLSEMLSAHFVTN